MFLGNIEKHETCGRCGAQYNQIEYDLQMHKRCPMSIEVSEDGQVICPATGNYCNNPDCASYGCNTWI